jgi:hypothetical protein
MVAANSAIAALLTGVAPRLLEPPVNVLRVALHPEGLAPRVENFGEWRAHLLSRLRHQIDATADPVLVELHAELQSYPLIGHASPPPQGHLDEYGGVLVPFRVRTDHGVLSFFGTTTVFGTPLDITLAELAIESFFPAEAQTATQLLAASMARGPGASHYGKTAV